ncbi:hypothetical protein [Natrinema halophilum]|uniref:DUF2178 domain-containing protein n=1 Tax=Natrinema halophilum TaxID=1699371 RepID=A0A7D5KZI4_9EURY|nr:hypothetical protein [Natrinema halophilum]QLG49300.1 hypothetical protein HYG82_10725 [Natrinema halophilum]
MATTKRDALVGVVSIGMIVSLAALYGRTALLQQPNAWLTLGGGMLSAGGFGWYLHDKSTSQYDERSMHIRYRSGYVAFWAVYWLLTLLAIGGIQESGEYRLPMDSSGIVASLWVFGTLILVVSRLWYKRKF